jgi:FKBP-type peptidyl-prolyl cis-trans isomerase FkpA
MRSLRWMTFSVIGVITFGCIDKQEIPSTDLQMQADIETIDAYLSSNNITAYEDKSGIRFHIEQIGTGLPPTMDQSVDVDYVGKLMNGFVFDQKDGFVKPMEDLIDGWKYGLLVWPAGTKGTLYVPSPLGYGNQTVGSIPANSILMFDITLVEVIPNNSEKARLTSDIGVIDEYLAEHAVDAVKDPTGVRYVITTPGTGTPPTWYDKVRFTLSGKSLATGTEFYSGTAQPNDDFDSRVVDYLHGIKIALSKIGVGGKITIYVPSGLAFGPYENTQASLPANSIVYYTIELQEIY